MRPLTKAELPGLEGLARDFWHLAYRGRGEFAFDRFTRLWESILDTGNGFLVVAEVDGVAVGAIGGLLYEESYCGTLIATEFFWYVDPAHRGCGLALLQAFESWAAAAGAVEVRMVNLSHSMPERLEALYTRRGYTKIETHWSKPVDARAGLMEVA